MTFLLKCYNSDFDKHCAGMPGLRDQLVRAYR